MERYRNAKKPRYLLKFKHSYSFYILNLGEIVSLKIEDFYARQSAKTARERIFVWGSYDLIVRYWKYRKKEKITQEKVLAKGFSYVFPPLADYPCEAAEQSKENLICEADYDYRITPVPLFLFPLLSRVKFIPFKVAITVQGKIISIGALKDAAEEKDSSLEKYKISLEDNLENAAEEVIPSKEERPVECSAKKEVTSSQQKDLIAQEKQKVATGIPAPNPQYYRTYRLFYDHFYKNTAGKIESR